MAKKLGKFGEIRLNSSSLALWVILTQL